MPAALRPSIHWLLIFIPVAIVLERIPSIPPPLLFFCAALSIVPIARLIVQGTEQIASRTGDTIGGLLNATFGNAPELIISIVALRAGYDDMVRASLIGAILANLLLALGVAFFVGGLRHHDQKFSAAAERTYSTMLLLAVVSLAAPSAFSRIFAPDALIPEEASLNLGVACVLLVMYALFLVFCLKTHPREFAPEPGNEAPHHATTWSVPRAVGVLVGASALAAWMSEILVGAADGTGKALGMSEVFIGIVLLAVVGGAAESGSAVAMAAKNRPDLTIGIALGSSIQIALFVAPALVLASYFIAPAPLELSFSRAEISVLFIAVLLGAMVCGDGRSNWFRGVQLITVYVIFAMMFYFVPTAP